VLCFCDAVGEGKKDCNLISAELRLNHKKIFFKYFESKSYERTKKLEKKKKSEVLR